MKIQYASDLHLEFKENSNFLKHHPLTVSAEVLVLAGDIGYIGDDNYSRHPFWGWASENYRQVIVIPGNHEFYKQFDISKLYDGWSLQIRENILCCYNSVIPLNDETELIATTLWGRIGLQDAFRTDVLRLTQPLDVQLGKIQRFARNRVHGIGCQFDDLVLVP